MTTRRRSAKGFERHEEIVNATFEVLSQDGYSGASLAQIGRAIGIERAHILYYFDSREQLLQEVLGRWDESNGFPHDSSVDFFASWVASVRRNLSNPGILQLYTTFAIEAANPTHAAHSFFQTRFRQLERAVTSQIELRQTRGETSRSLNAGHASMLLISLSDGLQVRWLSDRTFNMVQAFETGLDQTIDYGGHTRLSSVRT